jgi:hypothetical protein
MELWKIIFLIIAGIFLLAAAVHDIKVSLYLRKLRKHIEKDNK